MDMMTFAPEFSGRGEGAGGGGGGGANWFHR